MESFESGIRSFCAAHREVYLYGAGKWAVELAACLASMNMDFAGFLVSGIPEDAELSGKPVRSAKGMALSPEDGIILAFQGATSKDVVCHYSEEAQIFSFDGKELHGLTEEKSPQHAAFVSFVQEHPCAPFSASEQYQKIAVVRLDVLGDLVMTSAFLRELRAFYPDSDITLIVWKPMQTLMENCPYVDRVLPYECPHTSLSFCMAEKFLPDAMARTKNFLRQGQDYDAVFLPRAAFCGVNILDEMLLAMQLSPVRIGRFVAFENVTIHEQEAAGRMFSACYHQTEIKHETQAMLDILRMLGAKITSTKNECWIQESAKKHARNVLRNWRNRANLSEGEDVIFVACGLTGSDPKRTWPASNWTKLMESYRGKNVVFLLLGAGKQASDLRHAIRPINPEQVIDLVDQTTLQQAAAIIADSTIYVGADTGLMHLAAASSVPVVELSIWNEAMPRGLGCAPVRMGPWGVRQEICLTDRGANGSRRIDSICVETVRDAMDRLLGE